MVSDELRPVVLLARRLSLLLIAAATSPVLAQDTVWIANATGDFGAAANWTSGVPDSATSVAHFGSDFASDLQVIMRRGNILADNTFTLSRLYINPAPGAGNFTFAPATSQIFGTYGAFEFRRNDAVAPRVDVTRGSHTIAAAMDLPTQTVFDVAAGATLTTTGVISGNGGITKDGGGTLYLDTLDNTNNTYRGQTVINNGVVVNGRWRSLGYQAPEGQGGSNGILINPGGTLLFNWTVDYAPSKPISVLGDGYNGQGAIRQASGTQTGWQEVTFRTGQTTLYVEGDHPTRGQTMLSFGNIRGDGDIAKYGPGIFDLEIPSPTFAGTVTIREGNFHLRHFVDSLGVAKRLTLASQTHMTLLFDQFDPVDPVERTYNATPTTIGGFNNGGGVLWQLDDTGEYVRGTRGGARIANWRGNLTLDDDFIVVVTRPEDTMRFTGTIRGAGGITKAGAGTMIVPELTPRLLYVNGGTLRLANGGADTVHRLRDFSIATATDDPTRAIATLDLASNYLVLEYGPGGTSSTNPYAVVRERLRSGLIYGTGLVSTSTPAGHRVGYVPSSVLDWFNIGNEVLDDTSLVVGVMANGDTNFDGAINAADYWALRNNFGGFDRGWWQGDFDYDGAVWTADFNLLAGHFGVAASPSGVTDADWARLAQAVGVPEPSAAVALLTMAVPLLVRRRARSRDTSGEAGLN